MLLGQVYHDLLAEPPAAMHVRMWQAVMAKCSGKVMIGVFAVLRHRDIGVEAVSGSMCWFSSWILCKSCLSIVMSP